MTTLYVDNIAPNLQSTISAPNIKLPTGSVIQTIENTFNTQTGVAGTSFISTNHSLSITPKFSTSKILIMHMGTVYNEGNNLHQYRTLYRDATHLAPGNEGLTLHSAGTSSSGRWSSMGFNFVDSPSTTNQITYTVYFRGNSGSSNSFYCYGSLYPQTLIIQEIAG